MRRFQIVLIITLILLKSSIFSQDMTAMLNQLSRRQLQADMEFLGMDLLEGRAPGTRGGSLAEHYVKAVLKGLDIAPFGDSYFHPFTLKGYLVSGLSADIAGISLTFPDDIVGTCPRDRASFDISGDMIFAGYGICSDTWSWDDYKDVDVQGKIVLVRVNEPGRDNPELFEGESLTYYGRWTYKIEEAARRGAKGILLIHTDETAGYAWHVVRNSWSGEELYLPQTLENDLWFRGWISEPALCKVLASGNIELDALYSESEKTSFKPISLKSTAHIHGRIEYRQFETQNVVGYIRGSDPAYADKAILLSAHTDHLGMIPGKSGDNIYNGAIDNGSAVAAMLSAARVLKACQDSLRYSVIILGCQAEESGLLGSYQFANEIDADKIICNFNFESTPVWEKTRDFMGIGARYSTLEDLLKIVLIDEGLDYSYFSMRNSGFFYRSDQFSFARKGIPGIWITAGECYEGGKNRLRDFFTGNYHTVDDEYDPNWQLESYVQTVSVTLRLIDYINKYHPDIRWKGRMTFPVDK